MENHHNLNLYTIYYSANKVRRTGYVKGGVGGAQRAPEERWVGGWCRRKGVLLLESFYNYKAWKTISVISGNAGSTPNNTFLSTSQRTFCIRRLEWQIKILRGILTWKPLNFFDTIPLRKFCDTGRKQGNNTRRFEIQIAQQNYSFSQSKTFNKYYIQ